MMDDAVKPMVPGGATQPILDRLEDQIGWYDRNSQKAQRALKLAQVIIAGLIPLMSVFPLPEPAFKPAAAGPVSIAAARSTPRLPVAIT